MADNWVPITTALYDQDGTTFDGSLIVRLPVRITTVDGEVLGPDVWKFPVEAGVAKKAAAGATMELPITEDSNPSNVSLGLTKMDSNGRTTYLGAVIIPRPAEEPFDPIALVDLLPVGEEE